MCRLLPFSALLAAACAGATPAPKSADDLDWPVPPFVLTERSGRRVTNADLRGKAWVASFVFTRCSGPCPALTATVAKLQEELKGVPDVRFVTFTVDPDRDTPDELKKYAERFGADPERWLFLTGPEKELHALATGGFKLLAAKKPNGDPGDEFDHSTKLAVVDKGGVIHRVFDGMTPPRPGGAEQHAAAMVELKRVTTTLAE